MSQSTASTNGCTVLLLGSGGREHAIAWKLSQSPRLGRLVCAPGNPGIAGLAELRHADIENGEAVLALARELAADLVVIGPEAPLAAGVADTLRAAGFAVFGPSQAAARLEWDKAYSKEFMHRFGIPTAASRTFASAEADQARAWAEQLAVPIVIKASGLAAGKGVVIATTVDEALNTLDEMLSGNAFGDAGTTVVIEEFMVGQEASVFAVTDGVDYRVLAPSQDHKRVADGDVGPNTGGMGAYAPAPIVTPQVMDAVCRTIIEPALQGMREIGSPYVGCLFVGLMIHEGEARVVEFNSRFGDPETQVILPLYNGDLLELFLASANGGIAGIAEATSSGTAACVVMASEGYPGSYRKGAPIAGIDSAEGVPGVVVFHAGTAMAPEGLVTNGGRVLGVTAVIDGDDLQAAVDRAYLAVARISWPGAHFRTDIGAKGIASVTGTA